ncbi:MAG: hypothetical protein LBC79_02010, partial [Deltaproteobacteria bacterium]|nr:hypothetical protein [Deltaproteobacteria bacterium]
MRRIFGFFVLILALAWPGVGFGQEYTFGKNGDAHNAQSGASAGSGGKIGFCLAPRFLDSLANTGNIDGSG